MKLLDLFAGAGGAGHGYYLAGFTVVGVDVLPQPHNPHEFHQDEALGVLDTLLAGESWQGYHLSDFSAIHASPPCQAYSVSQSIAKVAAKDYKPYPKLILPVRERLVATGLPWVIENVVGSELPDALMLCGSMFGLPIRRHRWFSSSHYLFAPSHCIHTDRCINPIGGKIRGYGKLATGKVYQDSKGGFHKRESCLRLEDGQKAMEIGWMTMKELSQAIPPAYTQWIASQLFSYIVQAKVS